MSVEPYRDLVQQSVDAVAKHGTAAAAARVLGVATRTVRDRVTAAKKLDVKAVSTPEDHLIARVKRLEAELAAEQKKALTDALIKNHIIGLTKAVNETPAPSWLLAPTAHHAAPGVPTLFLSDLHWGEVVKPNQINNVNRYNMEIAAQRLEVLGQRAVRLLSILSPSFDYPGLVLVLGGDMISGNIHDELTATNEMNSMPTVLDLYGKLCGLITGMADKFGKVFLPCVTGNHGRDTHKIWNKDRHHTSFDWLLYQFLAKHFENDKRVTFLIPDGPDAYFKVHNTRYLLTHGDQFRGGDGMIGALGPIIRGDHRKRSRNAQVDLDYDVMLLGHWHQLIHLNRLVVNGSLKGYDEYAYNNNFPYEIPQQALWLTHPKHGVTFRAPVYVDRSKRVMPKTAWVSLAEAA